MKKWLAASILATVALNVAAQQAQRDPNTTLSARYFRELDRNGDGYLTEDELWGREGEGVNWATVDRNRDGRISPSEFIALPAGKALR